MKRAYRFAVCLGPPVREFWVQYVDMPATYAPSPLSAILSVYWPRVCIKTKVLTPAERRDCVENGSQGMRQLTQHGRYCLARPLDDEIQLSCVRL
jgi:hypothetical protein